MPPKTTRSNGSTLTMRAAITPLFGRRENWRSLRGGFVGPGANRLIDQNALSQAHAMRKPSTRVPHRILEQNFSIASEMFNQGQRRASDRTRIRADRARDNVDLAQAATIEAGEDLRRAGGEALAHRRRQRAVDHDRLKVDDRERSAHRIC